MTTTFRITEDGGRRITEDGVSRITQDQRTSTVVRPLTTTGLITLFQLDCTPLGGQWFYFASAEDFQTIITWGGQDYSPLPMEATGFEMTTRGAIPQPNVTISNLFGAGNTLLELYDGLLGARLWRVVTLRRFLDDGETPDANAYISRDMFVIAQKTSHNAAAIVFKLTSPMDQEGTQLPRRQVMRDMCQHVYRRFINTDPNQPEAGYYDYSKSSCPYTAYQAFNLNDQPTTPPYDVCSKHMTGCVVRFGNNVPLPARFFPGVGRVR